MEIKKIRTNIQGIGEIEISIIQTGETWWCNEIENFATHSSIRFSAMVMSKPELQSDNSFQLILQRFITFIQNGGEPQSSNRICNHFNNWLNKQNGVSGTKRGFIEKGSNLSGTAIIRPDKTFERTF